MFANPLARKAVSVCGRAGWASENSRRTVTQVADFRQLMRVSWTRLASQTSARRPPNTGPLDGQYVLPNAATVSAKKAAAASQAVNHGASATSAAYPVLLGSNPRRLSPATHDGAGVSSPGPERFSEGVPTRAVTERKV